MCYVFLVLIPTYLSLFQTGIQILRSLLGQQLGKGRVSEEQYKDMMQEAQANLTGIIAQNQEEQQQEEEVSL